MNIDKFKHIGYFISTSGERQHVYYDFRPLLLDNLFAEKLAYYIFSNYVPCNIIGVEFWGAVMLAKIQTHFNAPFHVLTGEIMEPVIFRKKKHVGHLKQTYGELNQRLPTYILDDVITTGCTVREVFDHFRNVKIDGIFVMLNRLSPRRENYKDIPVIELHKVLR
ncbi:MAG: hypothetical protein DRI44_05750 [Chlamydiae bacterium]|nr:MAG: hypothetical protein DRI44_05750 [Chlamydiota bacterium]